MIGFVLQFPWFRVQVGQLEVKTGNVGPSFWLLLSGAHPKQGPWVHPSLSSQTVKWLSKGLPVSKMSWSLWSTAQRKGLLLVSLVLSCLGLVTLSYIFHFGHFLSFLELEESIKLFKKFVCFIKRPVALNYRFLTPKTINLWFKLEPGIGIFLSLL